MGCSTSTSVSVFVGEHANATAAPSTTTATTTIGATGTTTTADLQLQRADAVLDGRWTHLQHNDHRSAKWHHQDVDGHNTDDARHCEFHVQQRDVERTERCHLHLLAVLTRKRPSDGCFYEKRSTRQAYREAGVVGTVNALDSVTNSRQKR